ncbi:MAG: bifunctional folylpolyglutamate synthase/dihydrofolate synthase [Coriobacteriales bacterium]|jgi:dihydrofolate synthase/folylpolyglutamate synthase|nr:bifunctional folylpolyglutamate synthase/dihydrofolate synthase [Coriobacteriales bacterium]
MAHNEQNYEQALYILHDALKFGIDPSLDGIRALMREMGDPYKTYDCIQIAGTNGKSSTARYTASLLRAQGLNVGLYTSPELVYYEERMEINGRVVSRAEFAESILAAKEAADAIVLAGYVDAVTEFELLTTAALWLFSQKRIDVAVLEVGMGGRWDATSVVTPAVATICGVGLDHTAILGDTLEEIAAEKAAIIKPGCEVVLGPGTKPVEAVFLQQCEDVGVESPIYTKPYELDNTRIPSYQAENIATAISTAQAYVGYDIDATSARVAIDATVTPGRFETICEDPLLLIDAAHNPQSAEHLASALAARFGSTVPATLLLAILKDKDADGIIDALAPLFSDIVATETASPRAREANDLANMIEHHTGKPVVAVYDSVESALAASAANGTPVVATGSITLAGEVKRYAGEAYGKACALA